MTIHAQASKLDMDKFAKVHRLMTAGATEGERAAAKARAEAMAQRAGMTLKQAVSKVDIKPKPSPAQASSDWRDIFRGFDDWCEEREPGYKAKHAQKKADRERRRADRRRVVLERYGSEQAVFALNAKEAALYAAATPFAKRNPGFSYLGKDKFAWTSEIDGAREFRFREDAGPEAQAAIRDAWPMPDSLPGLLTETMEWDSLHDDRQAFIDGEYQHHAEVEARMELLEHELHNRPAETWDDVEARFAWEKHKFERQWVDPTEEKPDGLVMTLRRDFEMLRRRYDVPAQNGRDLHPLNGDADNVRHDGARSRRTNADKQRDVLSTLDAEPELSDREIARRCGVSPQTIGNWRRRRVA
ncbi:conserved hypothetical protein [Hyphomicrobiales bacterium]|nr:conserved hypothetical protein [Hyphomicrobiales bacterium]CAH1697251.1 conserved hypothetical protein [Hyphomicrobiales bacterium]CAI0342819.1 conserved hypothetical protein [Hyphomicrobiales bacterium]